MLEGRLTRNEGGLTELKKYTDCHPQAKLWIRLQAPVILPRGTLSPAINTGHFRWSRSGLSVF
jgi:hypothetical protein